MRVFDSQAIRSALDWRTLIAALDDAFAGTCTVPQRHHHEIESPSSDAIGEGGIMLIMPAWIPGRYLGTKLATLFSSNASRGLETIQASYVLSDAATGQPLAVFDGGEITQRRTAAASALASTRLSRSDAATLLMVGTGRLAPYLIEAHCSVRPIEQVLVWGRTREKAERLVARLEESGRDARVARDLEDGVRGADIVSCATFARSPLVLGAWLREGSHLDLVGGFTYEMREADDEAISGSSVFVDTRAGALSEAGDLLQPIDAGVFSADDIRADLHELARGEHAGRTSQSERTTFKSVGTALEDLAAAIAVWESAQ